MPAANWTTNEQYIWLQDQMVIYMVHVKEKDYSHFWPPCHLAWFAQFPECAVVYPDIPMDVELTPKQKIIVKDAEDACEAKNCSLKKKLTVFDDTLQSKRCAKSEAKIYSEMYHDKHIKPLVMAEEDAGNVATSGKHVTLGQKFSRKLLEDETEDIKVEVCEKYKEQLTHKKGANHGKNILDDDNDKELDAEAIMWYI
ncbi:uncharacterized protein EDB91DRAFT_1243572 [Suillus paluster]|uniref:uncharacterized protein n=1 Tax=Suillus paluster TaxID=48578 RepID=UPI001B87629B|nr:uncharacterized protein EDB91DRAFT_1243572 [Suillus paluster]KAG1751302.1 hypothetical protein EDB91DRAFT_1243572 [Suillus paluster]